MSETDAPVDIEVHAATPDRWDDVVHVAGDAGFYNGCWCQWWRKTNAELAAQAEGDARAALEELVKTGRRPGLIGYVDGQPVAWVSIAPREELNRLTRTKKLQSIDGRPSMVVGFFFVAKEYRRHGITDELLRAAVDFARAVGADLVEGFPVPPSAGKQSSARAATGALSTFERAGFVEAVRREGRPSVRLEVRG